MEDARIGRAAWSLFLMAGVVVACASACRAAAGPAPRPNVLLILTDDQRADTVAALGNAVIRTPTLDALAARGMVFRNAYCFGSNSPGVCLPSRNMLLSGRAYFRWEGRYAPADGPNLPAALRRAGYVTYHHGKRGNTAELIQASFETSKYLASDTDREGGEPGLTIVNEAIEFLKRYRARGPGQPFFMYLAPPNPHDPRVAAPEYLDLYGRAAIPLPRNYLPVHPFDNGEMTVRDELLAPWPRTADEIRRHLHEYYASITGLDHHLGRLLRALEELGLADRTVVIFSSDNGLAVGSHGLMGKQNLYEHSAKVPLILAGPGVARGATDAMVYLMDLFPTICDLADARPPDGLDGRSLKGIVEATTTGVREAVLYCYRDVQRAVRDARYKLIRYPKIDRTQLFDLRADPDETKDLSGEPAQADRIERLMARLADLQGQYGDPVPLRVAAPGDATFTPPTGRDLEAVRGRWRIRRNK